MIDMKAEKYLILTDVRPAEPSSEAIQTTTRVRFGFGAAGEEVQRVLETNGVERVRVRIDGENREVMFLPGRAQRLLDIKQKIKSLSFSA